ncbi:unnamed protein product [marine sediment metagenome]|uniref:Zer-1-like leucine-rich repeats region domain-containing protein n=1 Tax=marine sediment metagenome TaxID=412755 RepID=X0UP83_9ZZZZ
MHRAPRHGKSAPRNGEEKEEDEEKQEKELLGRKTKKKTLNRNTDVQTGRFDRISARPRQLLMGFADLEVLDLSGTGVTNAGLACLSAFKKLQTLSLHNTGISGKGLAEIAKLKTLKCLELSQTSVGSSLELLENLT